MPHERREKPSELWPSFDGKKAGRKQSRILRERMGMLDLLVFFAAPFTAGWMRAFLVESAATAGSVVAEGRTRDGLGIGILFQWRTREKLAKDCHAPGGDQHHAPLLPLH
ncbi:hypothetical protein LIA77_03349 [Sarocladium implicatum]|nr:hypothetical protein LIA77_03349 [Sarocladium implicatum]